MARSTSSSTIRSKNAPWGSSSCISPNTANGSQGARATVSGVPGAAAVFINEGVAEDREQPPLGIGPLLVLVPGAVRLEQRFLHQVVGIGGVAREAQRHAVQHVEVHQRLALEAGPLFVDGGR